MQHRIEATGRSVDEALQNALAELGARRADVRVEVQEPGSAGFLGIFGGRPARVCVERLVRRHRDVRELVLDLLETMQIPAEVRVSQAGDAIEVWISTRGFDGLLIGRRGQTLTALQHIIGRLVSREFGQDGRVEIEIGDYRQRREQQLVEKARVLAQKVRATGREVNLEPLHAPDRRIIHMALAGMPGVRTYTVGQGLHRNVVIAPDERRLAPEA